ncbi:MAG: NAD(P)H-dependent oxidoreductase [Pseudomonadota bacterium]
MSRNIFILNGHPGETSLSRQFAERYHSAAQSAGHTTRLMHIRDMAFDADHGQGGYADAKKLEPDLENTLNALEWAQHIVLTTPMWWGGMPAMLKGLFDRTLVPGRTFDTRRTTAIGFPAPMLIGKSARVFMTSDTPDWFFQLIYGAAMQRQLKSQVFGFVGIKPTRFTHFAPASHPKEGQVDRWLETIAKLGAKGL